MPCSNRCGKAVTGPMEAGRKAAGNGSLRTWRPVETIYWKEGAFGTLWKGESRMSVIRSLLTDKSFWAALIALATTILMALNVPQGSVEQFSSLLSAVGVFIAYIISNSIQQAAAIKADAQRDMARAMRETRKS